MADKRISQLANILGSQVDDANDEIAIVDSSSNETKAITRAELMSSVANVSVDGSITVGGTVDGRDVASDGSKLDGIESGATADQTAGEIKTAYESNADTNAFTDAEQSKLAGIEAGAQVNTVDSVNTQTGAVVLDADDIDDSTTTHKFTTAADISKLDGIEAGADVTDTANVTAAGALMDSELTSEASVKALDQGVATTDSPDFAGLTVDTDTLYVDSSNNRVGIGTSSPSDTLDVNGVFTINGDAGTGIEFDVNSRFRTLGSGFQLDASNNSSSSPTYTFRGDGDTGMFQAGSNRIGFSTGGAEAMRIDSSGNVGIGTSSPDTALHVFSGADGKVAQFTGVIENRGLVVSTIASPDASGHSILNARSGGSAGILSFQTDSSEAMRIDSDGNVGIGTSSPSELLEVASEGATAAIEISAGQPSATTGEAKLVLRSLHSSSGTTYSRSEIASLGVAGGDSDLLFRTTTTSAGPVEAMRIDSSGNVGIGTSSPGATLDVNGSLSKNSGSFKIDHPVKPDTHHLVHSFIEGPQADNLYRGKVTLVDGSATVNLDEAGRMTEGTFVALNGNVQCWTTNEDGWTQVRGKVEGNTLTIEAQDPACTDEVSWLVIGERHDQHMIETEWTDENGRVITEPAKENTQ